MIACAVLTHFGERERFPLLIGKSYNGSTAEALGEREASEWPFGEEDVDIKYSLVAYGTRHLESGDYSNTPKYSEHRQHAASIIGLGPFPRAA